MKGLTLKGRTCVFAGGTGEIGRGAVRILAENGMNVVLVTHSPKQAEEVVSSMKDLAGNVVAVSNEMPEVQIFELTEKNFGSVDVVINSIGGLMAPKVLSGITKEELDEKLHHQITEVFWFMKEAIPFLKKSSAGRMILTSSCGARTGFEGESILDSIARGGVETMTKCFARELAADGITVNCIARSGLVNDHTPRNAAELDVASFADRIPLGRIGKKEEYGALAAYLASEEGGFVTGQTFDLCGGLQL